MRRKLPVAGHVPDESHVRIAGEVEGATAFLNTELDMPPPRLNPIAGHFPLEDQVISAGMTEGAEVPLNTARDVPPPPSIAGHVLHGDQELSAGNAEGATLNLHPAIAVPPPPPAHIAELIEWQRRRVHAIRAQSQCDRSCDAYVSRYLGYHSGLPKTERLALMKQAAQMRAQVEKSRGRGMDEPHVAVAPDAAGGEGHGSTEPQVDGALTACLPIIVNSIQSRGGWDALRKDAERRMREIARSMPVWPQCESVAGFADLGLASIVAEAGNDLSAYPHYYHLWKRLGLAPYKGRAVSSWRGNELKKAEWIEAGYNPVRRGQMAGDVGVALFFAKSKNDYGTVYTERRERTALTHPDWTPGHSDADARRIMLKAFVADLWRWWREAARAVELADAA